MVWYLIPIGANKRECFKVEKAALDNNERKKINAVKALSTGPVENSWSDSGLADIRPHHAIYANLLRHVNLQSPLRGRYTQDSGVNERVA